MRYEMMTRNEAAAHYHCSAKTIDRRRKVGALKTKIVLGMVRVLVPIDEPPAPKPTITPRQSSPEALAYW